MQRDSYDTWWEETRYLRPFCLMYLCVSTVYFTSAEALNTREEQRQGRGGSMNTASDETSLRVWWQERAEGGNNERGSRGARLSRHRVLLEFSNLNDTESLRRRTSARIVGALAPP
jgi:hypothetical protein